MSEDKISFASYTLSGLFCDLQARHPEILDELLVAEDRHLAFENNVKELIFSPLMNQRVFRRALQHVGDLGYLL